MMRLKIFIALSLFIFAFINGCKKEAGPGGKNTISGTVMFKNGLTGNNEAANMATVTIAYKTSESTSAVDKTVLTDSEGKFSFEGLNKGDYFIKAGYTDSHDFNYTTPGYGVTIKNKKKKLELNIVLE